MRKLAVKPEQDGYGYSPGFDVVAARLGGGAGRQRQDYEGSAINLQLTWRLTAAEYNYMCAFYRTGTVRGSEPFLIDLIFEDGIPTEHLAKMTQDTWELAEVSGDLYVVRFGVEARPGVHT